MIIAKIRVNGVIAKIVYRKVIPAGIIGAQVEFDYDEDIWHELHKTVVFKGAVTKDVITDANIVTIPPEVVEKPFFRFRIGVYGVDADGNIAIPTLWEDIGAICDAAAPSGDTNTDPSLPVWAQIQAMIGDLSNLTTTAKENLVAAINEAAKSGGGASIAMRVEAGYIQYSTDNGKTWVNLIAESDLKGDKGDKGADGITPHIGDNGNWYIGSTDTGNPSRGATGKDGAGMDITGASVGQIVKISAVDDTGKPTAWEAMNIPEQVQPDWNQNDSTAADYVKNRPFYSETRNVTVENVTDKPLKGFPAFVTGDTVNVNVDGMEHSLVAYYDESEGVFTIGDIYSDLENGEGQLGWQFYSDGASYAHFYATEAHTVSYLGVFIYKIDDKFLNLDGLVRTYNYHFSGEMLYKTLYNSAGDNCTLYTCSDFILPDLSSQLFGFMSEVGFSTVDAVSLHSCFITGFIITTMNAGIRIERIVLGTDTSDMETIAADNGYTYTTNPNA